MDKLRFLKELIKARKNLLVAFSGGVDSTLVAKVAYDALGTNALAVTADSCTLSRKELELAKKTAKEIGISHKIIKFSELENKEFARNPVNRCYYCRKELALQLKKIAKQEEIENIADGVNSSDLKEHRPGIKAANEQNIWHPLVEAKIGKEDVRALAKRLKLSVSTKPSNACLASRIPYNEGITEQKLKRIEKAEEYLKKFGFAQVRVRAHENIARIEVESKDIDKIINPKVMAKIIKKLKQLGFVYITLDLEGYRAGSMDEVLKKNY
ncbi:MAG: ATP-dependent sacrificial sulfur transferase LarE [Candidatus Thermoplasmatota archaeon]|nr:ATP-dependent sacrificial sulfur transferase LarE [Candidatus Thermoplasmatota archaeon]